METPSMKSFKQYVRRVCHAIVLFACLGLGWIVVHTAISVAVGVRDDIGPSDVIVVFGNKVELSGVPSPRLEARLDRALSLYNAEQAPCVLVSGGVGKEGHDELL